MGRRIWIVTILATALAVPPPAAAILGSRNRKIRALEAATGKLEAELTATLAEVGDLESSLAELEDQARRQEVEDLAEAEALGDAGARAAEQEWEYRRLYRALEPRALEIDGRHGCVLAELRAAEVRAGPGAVDLVELDRRVASCAGWPEEPPVTDTRYALPEGVAGPVIPREFEDLVP